MKMFDARKTGMIELIVRWKNYDDTLSRFHTILACHGQTDGRTDRQTDGRTDGQNNFFTISISRVSSSMLTRDKNYKYSERRAKTQLLCDAQIYL